MRQSLEENKIYEVFVQIWFINHQCENDLGACNNAAPGGR